MLNEKELMDKALKEVVQKCVDNLTDSYRGNSTRTAIENEIAKRIADKYLPEHELEILEKLNTDTIAKIATLNVLSSVIKKLGA